MQINETTTSERTFTLTLNEKELQCVVAELGSLPSGRSDDKFGKDFGYNIYTALSEFMRSQGVNKISLLTAWNVYPTGAMSDGNTATITLDKDEAETFRTLWDKIGGHPGASSRKFTDSLMNKIAAVFPSIMKAPRRSYKGDGFFFTDDTEAKPLTQIIFQVGDVVEVNGLSWGDATLRGLYIVMNPDLKGFGKHTVLVDRRSEGGWYARPQDCKLVYRPQVLDIVRYAGRDYKLTRVGGATVQGVKRCTCGAFHLTTARTTLPVLEITKK